MEVKQHKKYVSQDGFVEIPVLRGQDEVRPVYNILGEVTSHRSFICGGFMRWACSPREKSHKAGDIDIYSTNQEDFDNLLKYFTELGMEVRHENNVSVTFKKAKEGDKLFGTPVLQLIKPITEGHIVATGDRETVLRNFDFTVVRVALLSLENNTALADADYLHDEEKRLIRIKNIHCPISSTFRCMKCARKGYYVRPYEVLHLFLDWEGRTPEYRAEIAQYVEKIEGENITQEEIDKLEALMRID